jgi:hypothetical protein
MIPASFSQPEKHEVNELQLAQLKEVFELMDIDNSGAIDVNELRSCFKLLGMKVSFAEAKEMLKTMDTDGSGQEWPPLSTTIAPNDTSQQYRQGLGLGVPPRKMPV